MFSTCNFMKYQLGNYKDKNLPLASICVFFFFSPLCLLLTVSSLVGYPIGFVLSQDK